MAMTPKDHIEEIRRVKFSIGGEANPLTEDLHQPVKNLAAEIYAKDVHFLMELIQAYTDTQRDMDKKEDRKRWIQHYNSSQKILLVGEGDFSFSACLAKAFGTGVNMVATCLHSEEMLPRKHWTSKAHLEELQELGCLVLHEIDVCNMNQNHILRNMKFDIILFNFPHAGHFSWLNERDARLINMHRELIKAYFTSSRAMLEEGGEIHVTHRDDYPYNRWKVKKLAKQAGLDLKEKVGFLQANYPGYHNKRGGNKNCNKKFPLRKCFTFKFTLRMDALGVKSCNELTENASSESNSTLITTEEPLSLVEETFKDLHI